jgi:phospholipid-binding lipoprotein MlaA
VTHRQGHRLAIVALLVIVLPGSACVTYPKGWDEAKQGVDPYEDSNRAVFGFNEGLDKYLLEPVSEGWEFITWQGLRRSVDKFFLNLGFPRRFVTNLGQGEIGAAGSELGRFMLNTTVGLAGFFDPATHIGMELYDEDFGQMFGRWGVGTGPYWVLPVLGPSNPRDTTGLAFDLLFDVRTIVSFTPVFTLAWTSVVQSVNRRALYDEDLESARESALDFYIFMRDAYTQRRKALINNEDVGGEFASPGSVPADLYDVDFDDELDPKN